VARPLLLTGASGLLGEHAALSMAARLEQPVVLVRRETQDLLATGSADVLLDRYDPSAIVHLAWSASGTRGYRTDRVNDAWLTFSRALLQACVSREVAVWLTGTVVDRPEMAPGEVDRYTFSKQALLRTYRAAETSRAGWFRPFYVFDPAKRRPALVAQALSSNERGEALKLRTPDVEHDFIHARDVGDAIACAVAEQQFGEIDIGAARARPVHALVSSLGVSWTADPQGSPSRAAVTPVADTARLRALGWAPRWTEEHFSEYRTRRRAGAEFAW
jgi:nucleoside-diphosphate-sugar epimerase